MTVSDFLIGALPKISTSILILAMGSSTIAASAIGIDAMNKNLKYYKEDHSNSNTFLIINLVIAIIAILIAFVGMWNHFKPL